MSNYIDVTNIPRSMRYLDTGRTVSPASPVQLYSNTSQPPSLKIDVNKANNNSVLKHISEAEEFNRIKDARSEEAFEQRKRKKTALYPDGSYINGKFIPYSEIPAPPQRYNPLDYYEEYPPSLTFAGKNRKPKSRKSSKKKTKPRKSSNKRTKRRKPKSRKTKRRTRK